MRKVMLCGLLAGGWIVAASHAAFGQCYTTPTYSYRSYSAPSYSYSAPAYVAPVAKKVEYKADPYYVRYLAVIPLVDYPSYAAVYAPPIATVAAAQAAAPAAQAQPNGDLAKIMSALTTINKAVDLIDQRLTRLEGPPLAQQRAPQQQKAPGPPQPAATAQQIVAGKCAVCHNPEKAGDWGGGLTMVAADGKLERLSDKNVKKLIKQCMAGTMPPRQADAPKGFTAKVPDPLTDAEASTLVSFYSGATKDERLEIADVRPQPRTLVRRKE